MLEPSQNFTILRNNLDAQTLEEMDKAIVVEHTGDLIVNSVSL